MEVVLKKMGNSTAFVMPPLVLKSLGISAGQHLSLDTNSQGQIVLTPKRKYVLSEMIAQCDLSAPMSRDIEEWDAAAPVGGELL